MPEHAHLLIPEPKTGKPSPALHERVRDAQAELPCVASLGRTKFKSPTFRAARKMGHPQNPPVH